jgi:hypothetical protein
MVDRSCGNLTGSCDLQADRSASCREVDQQTGSGLLGPRAFLISLSRKIEITRERTTVAERDFQVGLVHISGHRVSSNDDQELKFFVRLDDYFPRMLRVPGFDNPPTFNDIHAQPCRILKHTPEVHLGKVAVHHPLQKMRAQTEVPFPPGRPLPRCQTTLLPQTEKLVQFTPRCKPTPSCVRILHERRTLA